MLVSEADRNNDEEEKEEVVGSKAAPNVAPDYRIGDTEDSKLFRKFLNSWESYFNHHKREVSASKKTNSMTAGSRKRRNKRQN